MAKNKNPTGYTKKIQIKATHRHFHALNALHRHFEFDQGAYSSLLVVYASIVFCDQICQNCWHMYADILVYESILLRSHWRKLYDHGVYFLSKKNCRHSDLVYWLISII